MIYFCFLFFLFLWSLKFNEFLPAKSVGNNTSAKATEHTTNCKYAHCYRVQSLNRFFTHILAISVFIHILHKIRYILQRGNIEKIGQDDKIFKLYSQNFHENNNKKKKVDIILFLYFNFLFLIFAHECICLYEYII